MSNFLQLQKNIIVIALCWNFFPATQSWPSFSHESGSLAKPVFSGIHSPDHMEIASEVMDQSHGSTEVGLNHPSDIEATIAAKEPTMGKETMRLEKMDNPEAEEISGKQIEKKKLADYNARNILASMIHIRESLKFLHRINNQRLRETILEAISNDVLNKLYQRENFLSGFENEELISNIKFFMSRYVEGESHIKYFVENIGSITFNEYSDSGFSQESFQRFYRGDHDKFRRTFYKDSYNIEFIKALIDASSKKEFLDDGNFGFEQLDLDINSAIKKHIGSHDIENLNRKEVDDAIEAFDLAAYAYFRNTQHINPNALREPRRALYLIDKLKYVRLRVARAIGEIFKRQLAETNSGSIHFSEDLQELIQIQDHLLPYLKNEVIRLGGGYETVNKWVRKEDIPHLIYYLYGYSPITKIRDNPKHKISYQDFLHMKTQGKVSGSKFGRIQLGETSEFMTTEAKEFGEKPCSDLARRLNHLLRNFGLFEIEKAAIYKDNLDDQNTFRLQNSILMTTNLMYKNNFIPMVAYEEFFNKENTVETATIDFFFGAYQDHRHKPTHRDDYLNFPSQYIHYSLVKNADPYNDMVKVLDNAGKRRATYGLLKLNFITDDRFKNIAEIDLPEGEIDREFQVIQAKFAQLNIKDSIFNKNKLIDILEAKVESDHSPESHPEKLTLEIQKVKNYLTDIAKLFVKFGDIENIKRKEKIRNILFLILDLTTGNYGKDLIDEEKISGNFKQKFEAMSHSSDIRARLHSIEQDMKYFTYDLQDTMPLPAPEAEKEFSDRIKSVLAEKDQLNASSKNSDLHNYIMLEEIEETVDHLYEYENLKKYIKQ